MLTVRCNGVCGVEQKQDRGLNRFFSGESITTDRQQSKEFISNKTSNDLKLIYATRCEKDGRSFPHLPMIGDLPACAVIGYSCDEVEATDTNTMIETTITAGQ